MKKYFAVLLSLLLVLQMGTFCTVSAATEYNVATNAAAFAYGSAEIHDAAPAVDGNPSTSWISVNATALRDFLILDLGTAYTVSSIDVTIPENVAQNFTVYGANEAKFADKTALTAEISGLTAGSETKIDSILSTSAFRYIIFQQSAEEISFGFSEIKVNTTDVSAEAHEAVGPVNLVPIASCVFAGGPSGSSYPTDGAKLVDGDPTTEHHDSWSPTLFLYDLGANNAQKIAQVAYQENQAVSYATDFQIVATNNVSPRDAFRNGDYVVLAESSGAPTFEGEGAARDSGLLIYEVAAAYRDTAYRFVGIYKASGYLGGSTLQVYKQAPPPLREVAANRPAFSYSSKAGTAPALALDGDNATAWISAHNDATAHDNFVIDLGQAKPVEKIEVLLAENDSAKTFTVYASNDLSKSRTKLVDVTASAFSNASSLTTIYTGDGRNSYQYLVIDKAPSADALGFAEIKVSARAAKEKSAPTSIMSVGKGIVTNLTGAAAGMTDQSAETRLYGVVDPGVTLYAFVDLGESLPVSHVAYQNIVGDPGSDTLTHRNKYSTDFKIVATNDDITTIPLENAHFDELTDMITGIPYMGPALGTNMTGFGNDRDTGLWIFETKENKQANSYRFVGIMKTEEVTIVQNDFRLGASTLQVYTNASDVVAHLGGKNRIVIGETGSVADDALLYKSTILNGSATGKLVGLFTQYDTEGNVINRKVANGSIPLAGAYNELEIPVSVTDGLSGAWSSVILDGRNAISYLSDLATSTKGAAYTGSATGTADFKQVGITADVSGTAGAAVVGMLVLNPGTDINDFDASDIYTYRLATAPKGAKTPWNYRFNLVMDESAPAGDYPICLVSDTGVLTDKNFTLTMYDVAAIKGAFASVGASDFMSQIGSFESFFGTELKNKLTAADDVTTPIGDSFMLAKDGFTQGLFNDAQTSWDDVNTITAAAQAALIIDASLSGNGIESAIASYGVTMPKIFATADYNGAEFAEILPSVMTAETDTAAELATDYKRTIALSLIANGKLADKEKALTNYSAELGILPATLETDYSMMKIADVLSNDMTIVKTSYAGGMDDIIGDIIADFKDADANPGAENKEHGYNSESTKGSGSKTPVIVPAIQPTTTPQPPVTGEVTPANTFTDVEQHKWAQAAIYELAERDILNGNGDGTFDPDGTLTREQAVKLLVLSMQRSIQASDNVYQKDNGYKDCVYGSWYYPYISYAKEKKLVNGLNRGEFGIGAAVTRQDLAVMLYRAMVNLDIVDESQLASFTDYEAMSEYAKDPVSVLGGMGIINGFPDGSFAPQEKTSRAQAAVIFARFLHLVENVMEGTSE